MIRRIISGATQSGLTGSPRHAMPTDTAVNNSKPRDRARSLAQFRSFGELNGIDTREVMGRSGGQSRSDQKESGHDQCPFRSGNGQVKIEPQHIPNGY